MQLTLSVRHGDASDALKQYAREQVEGLRKYYDRIVEGDIVLDLEGHRHIAEIRIHASSDTHFACSEAGDFRTAIDATANKLRRQLKRQKGKYRRRSLSREERARLYEGAPSPGKPPSPDPSVAPVEWDRISSSEAIERLRGSGEDVLVFVDTSDGVVKIARRDEEGSVSAVEAESFEIEES